PLASEVKDQLLAALEPVRATVASFPSTHQPSPGVEGGSRWHDWALPLAAGLVFALLGLSGWQYVQLERQRGTIDRLAAQLDEAHQRTAQLAEYQGRLESVDSRLALVTSSGVEVCTLKPVGDPAPAESRGVLFVASNRQHWYLKVEGLVPCPQGRSYQLWFITEDGVPVSAGTFDPKVGIRVELSSETMPAGTVAVSITLEPAGGSPEPSGPAVLYGDEAMRIL
ncbi:MAG: anti-sigma factor, partial [Thermoanaerobaculia bacterium]